VKKTQAAKKNSQNVKKEKKKGRRVEVYEEWTYQVIEGHLAVPLRGVGRVVVVRCTIVRKRKKNRLNAKDST